MQSEQTQSNTETEHPDALLRGLNSYKRAVREATMRQVRALPPERLLQIMQEGARLYRKRYQLSTWVELGLLLSWIPIGILLCVITNFEKNVVGCSLVLGVFMAISWHVVSVPWRMYRALADVLEHTDDLRLVGPTISMYLRPDDSGRSRAILGKTLCRLLPQLRSDHASLLTADQMREMLGLLRLPGSDVREPERERIMRITFATLKALEQVGNESAIPAVRGLASPYTHTFELREAAEHCLEHLHANAGQHREKQTLLRASSSHASVAPDSLLRPASGSVDTAADQLLRPQI